jgi:hypothetical protein
MHIKISAATSPKSHCANSIRCSVAIRKQRALIARGLQALILNVVLCKTNNAVPSIAFWLGFGVSKTCSNKGSATPQKI